MSCTRKKSRYIYRYFSNYFIRYGNKYSDFDQSHYFASILQLPLIKSFHRTLGLLLQFFSKSLFYQFRKIKICYQKCMYSPIFYTWMNQRYIRLHNWLWKNATRGLFKLKTTENRTKTVIFSLSRWVQRQYVCQNFRNSSQNSNLGVWCSTIQSWRT